MLFDSGRMNINVGQTQARNSKYSICGSSISLADGMNFRSNTPWKISRHLLCSCMRKIPWLKNFSSQPTLGHLARRCERCFSNLKCPAFSVSLIEPLSDRQAGFIFSGTSPKNSFLSFHSSTDIFPIWNIPNLGFLLVFFLFPVWHLLFYHCHFQSFYLYGSSCCAIH